LNQYTIKDYINYVSSSCKFCDEKINIYLLYDAKHIKAEKIVDDKLVFVIKKYKLKPITYIKFDLKTNMWVSSFKMLENKPMSLSLACKEGCSVFSTSYLSFDDKRALPLTSAFESMRVIIDGSVFIVNSYNLDNDPKTYFRQNDFNSHYRQIDLLLMSSWKDKQTLIDIIKTNLIFT